LGVTVEDFDLVCVVPDFQPAGERLADEAEYVAIAFAEPGERARTRTDEADFQRFFSAGSVCSTKTCGQCEAARADDYAAA